jgi:hypothetical protein
LTVPSTTSFRSTPPTARGADLSDRRRRFAEVDQQDARCRTRTDAPQRSVERIGYGEFVIQLQLTDDPLDPIDRRRLVEDGEDALALGFERGRSAQ